ncbi:MAG TPA: EipA family protein [Hyphomicrobiaceae bacterium]|nr:EipA family protein [Hyphomicrobiaceae bacterium]
MLLQLHTERVAHAAANWTAAWLARFALTSLAVCLVALPGRAQTCTPDDFARAVDQAGASLRQFNAENGPKVTAAVKKLQEKRGWSDKTLEEKAIEYLHTPRIAALDEKANELLSKIDTLGEVDEKSLDCSRLPALKDAGRELLAIMKEKAEITEANIAAAMRDSEVAASPAQPAATAKPKQEHQPKPEHQAKPERQAKLEHQPKQPTTPSPAAHGSWNAATSRTPQAPGQETAALDAQGRQPPPGTIPAPIPESEPGYTLDEIKAATKGFFGTISTNLGGVIEYAFSNYGRPTAYVLGSEGGGAFLAGARYGKGTLYMRSGGDRLVYWHGPSLGYDFGAEGSRTLFLIYRLNSEQDLFRNYAGVDGSAYVLGGVGLTLLKGGPVLMAPIRTGVGLRLGANIGYIRFTPHATWNPF